jgi:hypothetical protein
MDRSAREGSRVRDLFEANTGLRTEAEWRELLGGIVSSLSRFCGVEFAPTSWYTSDDTPGDASSTNCVTVTGCPEAASRHDH